MSSINGRYVIQGKGRRKFELLKNQNGVTTTSHIRIYNYTHHPAKGESRCCDDHLPGSYGGRVSNPGWWGESQLPGKPAHSPSS